MKTLPKLAAVLFSIAGIIGLLMSYQAHTHVVSHIAVADEYRSRGDDGGRAAADLAEIAIRNQRFQRLLRAGVGAGCLVMAALSAAVAFRKSPQDL